jgi:aldoxime dehydratase
MIFHVEYPRTVPAKRPDGHVPAAPRYSLRWERPISTLISDYFAIQERGLTWPQQRDFFELARKGFEHPDGPESFEIMRSIDEDEFTNAIVVGYWLDPVKHARWEYASSLMKWFRSRERMDGSTGAWRETLAVPYDRHETIYSEPTYRIGLGRTAGSVISTITTNGYFGAARDRLPLSAVDSLESPYGEVPPSSKELHSDGRRLRVSVPVNVATLRSGQYWAHAEKEQLDDYLENMRPRLMRGMEYLSTNKKESGTLALRVMTNLNDDGTERKETSVYAHFISLANLERWAESHTTHHAIYHHAIAMNRHYKEARQFVSWHELFVLPGGEFEYVNCHPSTGLLPYFSTMAVEPLLDNL